MKRQAKKDFYRSILEQIKRTGISLICFLKELLIRGSQATITRGFVHPSVGWSFHVVLSLLCFIPILKELSKRKEQGKRRSSKNRRMRKRMGRRRMGRKDEEKEK